MATLRAATTKGTVTLNPISGILTRPDTYQREGGEGKRLENKLAKWPFTQASKQANAKQTTRHPQQRAQKVAPEPQRGATADRHCLDFNLA